MGHPLNSIVEATIGYAAPAFTSAPASRTSGYVFFDSYVSSRASSRRLVGVVRPELRVALRDHRPCLR
eukprot:11028267-Alexandrium_andersonii.AAC.1